MRHGTSRRAIGRRVQMFLVNVSIKMSNSSKLIILEYVV